VRSWFRRNRWGLLALPVTAALAVGANAQRLHDYWWDQDLRHAAATGGQSEWVTWSDSCSDATGDGTRTFRVKVTDAVSTADAGPSADAADLDLPSDLTGWRITMDFEAAPDQVLFGCQLALLDDNGNRYMYRAIVNDLNQDIWPCVPEDHPGPRPSITAGEPRTMMPGEERPAQWTTRPVVVVPRGATITQVLLWWEQPDYLAVRLKGLRSASGRRPRRATRPAR
jgi:hypothetical protein